MTRPTALVATTLALCSLALATPARAAEPPSPSVRVLPGATQKISHSMSASRDTALMAWQLTPYSARMAGADVALVEFGFRDVSLRAGFFGFIELESDRPYDPSEDGFGMGLPSAGVAFWRGHFGYQMALAFDEQGRRWFGPRGLFEATLGFRHESEHATGSSAGDPGPDYSDVPHIGNFLLNDFAVRIPSGDFDFEFRLQNKLFFGSSDEKGYLVGPGADAIVRWRVTSWVHPFSSTFAEYLVGADVVVDGEPAHVPDDYLVRNLTGVAFPGRLGDIQVFTSIAVGHGKGLLVFQEELLWGGGVRLAFF